ncbi:MAG: hypothetical protein P8Y71_16945 [Pseudolabrys sp.]
MKCKIIVAVAAIALLAPGAAGAMDARHPDWPCHQIKVPTLSPAAFWTGPAINDVGNAWEKDETVHELALQLAARRTPLEKAKKAATAFVTGTPEQKKQKAKLLFAGLFSILNGERSQVMDGIERFAKRQQGLRDKIRQELTDLRAHQNAAKKDAAAIDKLGNQLSWDTRIFDERRQTINYVCDVPATIEHRLFALARAIQQNLN